MLDSGHSAARQEAEVSKEIPSLINQEQAPKKGSAFRERLKKEGVPILLESYMKENPWTAQQSNRDIWQNFFDANGFTVDGIVVDQQNNANGTVTVTIRGKSKYPFNRLVTIGAGFKSDAERSAGGKHEGSKVLNLSLLRDFGCSEVIYGSEDWELRFFLDEPEEGVIDEEMEPQRMMYAKLTDRPKQDGSFCRFTTTPEMAAGLVEARDFFYHSGNKDFWYSDIDNEDVGCRVHPGKGGNFYLNGQRVSYEQKGKWETVPGFTFWSKKTPKTFNQKLILGRDREIVGYYDFNHIFLRFFADSLTTEEAVNLFPLLKDFFEVKDYDLNREVGIKLLKSLCEKLKRVGQAFDFEDNYLAADVEPPKIEMFRKLGYKVCHPEMAMVGMRKMTDVFNEVLEAQEVKPNKKEKKRIQLLEEFMKKFFAVAGSGMNEAMAKLSAGDEKTSKSKTAKKLTIDQVDFKPVALFTRKGSLGGFYDVTQVMLDREPFRDSDPSKIISLYLHEVCHVFGGDDTAEFSYALTALWEKWNRYFFQDHETVLNFKQSWTQVELNSGWDNFNEMVEDFNPLLKELLSRQDFHREECIPSVGLMAGHRVAKKLLEIFSGSNFTPEDLKKVYQDFAQSSVWLSYQRTLDPQSLSFEDHENLQKDLVREVHYIKLDLRKIDEIKKRITELKKQFSETRDETEKQDILSVIRDEESELDFQNNSLSQDQDNYNLTRENLGDPTYIAELEEKFKNFEYRGVKGIDFREFLNPTYLFLAWLEVKNIVYEAPNKAIVDEFCTMVDFFRTVCPQKNDFEFVMLVGLNEVVAAAEEQPDQNDYIPLIRKIYEALL